ncbi:hypothetical protein GUJ93_ZPchr0011g28666 [Zizania palustris]|uniref:RING-type domain-containing protein n=1 Tax=Zizania palustris TaxID=103762 RepID=A0A8J5WIY2_ZIZPA|nr:hypothetical protein GUJ93_ZPchr0011g28666 [Zizania palustris]
MEVTLLFSVFLPHEHFQRPSMWPVRAEHGAGRAAAAFPRSDAAVPRVEYERHNDYRFGFVPASNEAFSSLEKIMTAGETSEVEGCCSVCLEDFEGGDELKKMPCSHVFHESCITDWLRVSHLCPLCRLALPTARRG